MKLLRTSFAHLVREKIIQGESDLLPEPAVAKDIVPSRMNSNAKSGKIFDEDHFGGVLCYREDDVFYRDVNDGVFKTQGPIGFGPIPVGPGTKPYYTMLSNSTNNTVANQRGIFTGSTTSPNIPEFNIYSKGDVAIGITWSIGQAEQSYTDSSGNITDIKCEPGVHVLLSLDPRIRTVTESNGNSYDLDDDNLSNDPDNQIHLVYETEDDVNYKLYLARGEFSGYNKSSSVPTLEWLTIPQLFTHLGTTYKRLMPVHFKLNKDGTGEFRVDVNTIQFNLTALDGKDGSKYAIPNSGLTSGDSHASYRVGGFDPRTYTGGAVQGMTAPVVLLGNVAVNDTDDSDGMGHTGLPPFIAGIPLTPIRRASVHDDPDNERPISVIDKQAAAGGDDAWLAYSYSGDLIQYDNGLEAVVDGQMYDIRGVATKALSGDLDVNLNYTRIKDRFSQPGRTINAVNIEAINVAVENASVYGTTPGELSLAMKIIGDTGDWTTNFKKANGLTTNSELDSHVTFFSKIDTASQSLTGFDLTDFDSQVTLRARAMETQHLP